MEGGWAIIKFYWHPNTFGNPTGAVGFLSAVELVSSFESETQQFFSKIVGFSGVQFPDFFFIPSTAAANYNTITRRGGNFQVFLCQLLLLKNRGVFPKNIRKSPESPS